MNNPTESANSTSDLFSMAIQHYNAGDIAKAKEVFLQVYAANPTHISALTNLALLCDPDETDQALMFMQKARQLAPQDDSIRQGIFKLLSRKKNDKFQYEENCLRSYPWISRNGVQGGEEILNLVTSLPFSGIFASDNLVTWGRNLSFMGDQALRGAIKNRIEDIAMAEGLIWRSAVVVWAARNGLKREGDFVECGTYKGTTARIIYEAVGLAHSDKKLWLYDVFDWSEGDKHTPLAALGPDLHAKVVKLFDDAPNVNIVQGYIPESFNKGLPDKISFMHIDMNNEYAELEALKVLWDRMVPGGILILDDYGWECLSDQKRGEDKFFAELGYTVLELPTGQGMVLK